MESDVLPRRACRVAILWQLKTARHIGGIAGLGQVGELLVKRLAGARTEKGIAISGICNRGRRHCSQRVAFRIGVMRYRNAWVKEMWSWLRGEGRRCRRKSDTISKCHRCCAMRIAVVDESNTARWIFQSGEAKQDACFSLGWRQLPGSVPPLCGRLHYVTGLHVTTKVGADPGKRRTIPAISMSISRAPERASS